MNKIALALVVLLAAGCAAEQNMPVSVYDYIVAPFDGLEQYASSNSTDFASIMENVKFIAAHINQNVMQAEAVGYENPLYGEHLIKGITAEEKATLFAEYPSGFGPVMGGSSYVPLPPSYPDDPSDRGSPGDSVDAGDCPTSFASGYGVIRNYKGKRAEGANTDYDLVEKEDLSAKGLKAYQIFYPKTTFKVPENEYQLDWQYSKRCLYSAEIRHLEGCNCDCACKYHRLDHWWNPNKLFTRTYPNAKGFACLCNVECEIVSPSKYIVWGDYYDYLSLVKDFLRNIACVCFVGRALGLKKRGRNDEFEDFTQYRDTAGNWPNQAKCECFVQLFYNNFIRPIVVFVQCQGEKVFQQSKRCTNLSFNLFNGILWNLVQCLGKGATITINLRGGRKIVFPTNQVRERIIPSINAFFAGALWTALVHFAVVLLPLFGWWKLIEKIKFFRNNYSCQRFGWELVAVIADFIRMLLCWTEGEEYWVPNAISPFVHLAGCWLSNKLCKKPIRFGRAVLAEYDEAKDTLTIPSVNVNEFIAAELDDTEAWLNADSRDHSIGLTVLAGFRKQFNL